MNPKIILKEYEINSRMEMISAVGEQSEIKQWDYVIAKDGNHWFWPSAHREPGAMTHCGFPVRAGKPYSEGYAGRVMSFPTKDGAIEIQGPWHSNSDALYEAVGVDIRDKHLTFGCVALERDGDTYQDIIYIDPKEGIVGTFERVDEIAQKLADELDRVLYVYSRSHGGSHSGPVYPKSWTEKQRSAYWKKE
jgi:hypothetical protein